MEVRAGEERIVLDAGTGILGLGEQLTAEGPSTAVYLFISHLHWDHIQGLPFFAPAYEEGCRIQITAPPQAGVPLDSILRGQMGPVHFPLPFEALSAEISFHELAEEGWEGTNVRVRSLRVRHASFTVGYRVEAFGRSVVFIPDCELVGGEYPVARGWMDRLVEFVDGADLLIHDAMFTTEEYQELEGWGHSTFSQVLELGERAGVRSLRFFHHSPKRADAELDLIVQHFREEIGVHGMGLELDAAAEGALDRVGLPAPAP